MEKLQLLLKPRLIRCRNRQLLPSIPTVKNLPINCLHSLKVVTKLSRAWGGWVYSTKNNYQAISQNVSKPPIGSVNEAYIGDKMLTQGVFTEREAYYVPEAEKKFLFNQPKYPHCLTLKKARKMRAINFGY